MAWLSRLKAVSLVIAIGLCAQITTQATPIVYEYTGIGSGSLGGISFNNASVTIIADADTSQIAVVQLPSNPPNYQVPDLFASITVVGIGTVTLTGASSFGNTNRGVVGISGRSLGPDIFDVSNSVFQTYSLDSSIGPVVGSSIFNPGNGFGTSGGNFVLNSLSDVSFQATLEPVPEPASCMIIVVGGTAFFVLRRKLQK